MKLVRLRHRRFVTISVEVHRIVSYNLVSVLVQLFVLKMAFF